MHINFETFTIWYAAQHVVMKISEWKVTARHLDEELPSDDDEEEDDGLTQVQRKVY